VDLKGYLASASIVALAISFGSQGLVQDVVISLTLIFSDAMDVGDMVEIAGTVVVVGAWRKSACASRRCGIFTIRSCSFPTAPSPTSAGFRTAGCLPTRTSRFRGRGPGQGRRYHREHRQGNVEAVRRDHFERAGHRPGGNGAGRRLGFCPRPFQNLAGTGNLIETTFRQQIVSVMKTFIPNYADWQVPVTYRAMTSGNKPQPHLESSSGANFPRA